MSTLMESRPIGNDHQSIVDQLTRMLVRAVGDRPIVRVHGSIRLSQWSEPEPAVVLLTPHADFYRSEFASGEDTLLVIEVRAPRRSRDVGRGRQCRRAPGFR
jgi:hypothetical protein